MPKPKAVRRQKKVRLQVSRTKVSLLRKKRIESAKRSLHQNANLDSSQKFTQIFYFCFPSFNSHCIITIDTITILRIQLYMYVLCMYECIYVSTLFKEGDTKQ